MTAAGDTSPPGRAGVAEPAAAPAPPLLRVHRGRPTAAELAALVTVLGAAAAAQAAAASAAEAAAVTRDRGTRGWADPAGQHRGALRPGPGAWRRSGQPAWR